MGQDSTVRESRYSAASFNFASPEDHELCRRIHRKFGTTYYFASRGFPAQIRRHVDALYGFVRVADELVDNPQTPSISETKVKLEAYRSEFLDGLSGMCPSEPVLRAFCDLVQEIRIPIEEPLMFLSAMESDLSVNRYSTFGELRQYMRGSAGSVGVMMCCILGAGHDSETLEAAKALGEAMQLTNFLRDLGEDARRDRVYLPQEDLEAFDVTYAEVFEEIVSDRFRSLMKFEIARARELYSRSDQGIRSLPSTGRNSVQLARILYSRILDRIEDRQYDVFSRRVRTSKLEKVAVAGRVWAAGLREKSPARACAEPRRR